MTAARFPFSPARFPRVTSLVVGIALAASGGLAAAAQPLDLNEQPLYVSSGVAPNVVLSMDDSASLRQILSLPNVSSCPGDLMMWSGWNGLAYDPSVAYALPPNADGSARTAPSFGAAPVDGFNPTAPLFYVDPPSITRNLATQFDPYGESGACFGARRLPPGPAFYMTGPDQYNLSRVYVGAADQRNFAIWFSFYRNRLLALKSATAIAMTSVHLDRFRFAWQGFNRDRSDRQIYGASPDAIGDTTSFSYARRTAFLTWLFGTMRPDGDTPTIQATIRAGEYFSKPIGSGANVTLPGETGGEAQCRANYHLVVTDGLWEGSTLNATSYNFDNTAVTLPVSDLADPPAGLTRYDPAASASRVYRGTTGGTLADVTFKYWSRDLLPNVRNRVPPSMPDPSTSPTAPIWNPANDPASWQHMVNHIVTLAIGNVQPSPADPATLQRFRTGGLVWPTNMLPSQARTLDTWHAALNSRGSMLMADRPQQVADYLRELLDTVEATQARTAPIALATGSIGGDDGIAYQVSMSSVGWSGDLVAYPTLRDGSLGDPIWSAACKLTGGDCPDVPASAGAPTPAANDRVIMTATPNGVGSAAFRWDALSSAQRARLARSPVTNADDALGAARLDWVRGVRDQEQARGGVLRNRSSLLGAVIDAQPVVVSKPYLGMPDRWPDGAAENSAPYSTFVAAHASRGTMIYVGADDGMLHAFDADGEEHFAYVPDAVIAKLPRLADPSFTGAAFVRGTPTVRDAFYNGGWHTTLVAPLGRGGPGLVALDVTSPTDVTEARRNVLWDRTAAHTDIGHIYATPSIVRLADGNWWAVSGNGYNSPGGVAALLLIRLSDGHVRTLSVGAVADPLGQNRANGLSGTAVADPDRDGIADFAIAGDVFGNLWRFELTGSREASWHVAAEGGVPVPVFKAKGDNGEYQPITATPRLVRGRASNRIVAVFGTGKSLEAADMRPGTTPTQSIYGIYDVATVLGVERADLAKRTLATGTSIGGQAVRTVSGESASSAAGWAIDLATDERVVAAATPRGNNVLLPTLVAGGGDVCQSAYSGWLMTLDAESGLAPTALDSSGNGQPVPVLDLDGDGSLGSGDLGGNAGGVAGVAFDTPILGLTLGTVSPEDPAISPNCDLLNVGLVSGTKGLPSTCFAPRRTSWRQVLQ